ncbi:MAG: glycosyltransferase family 2 protein [Solirubrobacterales bacterium]|nr:glycosyltransferase family 2 protein [Solirubrobacterales bacterium]
MSTPHANAVSVVLVSYNSEQTIAAAIDSIASHLPDAQIVLVDNGSTDQTCQIAREQGSVEVLEGHGNVGFGAGVNVGARAACGDLLLVLNPDAAILHANPARLSELSAHRPVGMLGCVLHDGRRSRYLKYSEWGWRRELYWLMVLWFLVPREMHVRRPSSRLRRSRQWISGAAFVVDRSEFLELGGFDESLFLYCEDVDLSRRYRADGAGVGTTDAIVVTHDGQGSEHGGHERIQGFALLSFLENIEKWDGSAAGRRSARTVLRTLQALSLIVHLASLLPLVGGRAAAKAQSAALLRSSLLDCLDAPPVSGAYPRARATLSSLLRRSPSTNVDSA